MEIEKDMTNRIYIFLFILLQACAPAKILNVAAPEANDSWIQFLIRRTTKIGTIENVFSETDSEDSKTFELERTLSVGAPNANSYGKDLIVDKGFIYIVGDTDGGIYNGAAGPIGTRDLLLGKYDSQMNPIWTRQIGYAGLSLNVKDAAIDPNGNVYIIGDTKGQGHFRGAQLLGTDDMFLIKFDSNGNELWARPKGIPNHSILPAKMTLDSLGNVYIIGNSTGPFGGPMTGANGFIIKFKSNGDEDWVRQIGIVGADSFPEGVAFDKTTNDLYVTGSGNANYRTNTHPGIGNRDVFIFKYDTNGNDRFFAQLGTASKSFNNPSIAVDLFGNVFVGGTTNGRFEQRLSGTSWLGTVAKYDSLGSLQWVRQFGPDSAPPKQAVINSILTDTNGNVFTTGHTNGNISDGGDDSLGDQDAFLTKHDPSGQNKWIQRIGTPGADTKGTEIKLDSEGNLYVIGNISREINGAPQRGTNDIFVEKYKNLSQN
ncbi:SBBP repeat-containing protein [Leptospira santarosai]|nr:SBBP repeat-containing protein [Leptospira santarosai]MDI7236849.1 SBBP repeat-containing protein [Leptospira santarosai]